MFAELFVRHNAQNTLDAHLVHGHFKAPENTIMLGIDFENPLGRWTKVTSTDTIHGHIFVLSGDGSPPMSIRAGPCLIFSVSTRIVFADFVNYLSTNSLTSVVGLQILIDGMNQAMLDAAVVRDCFPARIGGFEF